MTQNVSRTRPRSSHILHGETTHEETIASEASTPNAVQYQRRLHGASEVIVAWVTQHPEDICDKLWLHTVSLLPTHHLDSFSRIHEVERRWDGPSPPYARQLRRSSPQAAVSGCTSPDEATVGKHWPLHLRSLSISFFSTAETRLEGATRLRKSCRIPIKHGTCIIEALESWNTSAGCT